MHEIVQIRIRVDLGCFLFMSSPLVVASGIFSAPPGNHRPSQRRPIIISHQANGLLKVMPMIASLGNSPSNEPLTGFLFYKLLGHQSQLRDLQLSEQIEYGHHILVVNLIVSLNNDRKIRIHRFELPSAAAVSARTTSRATTARPAAGSSPSRGSST